MTNDQLSQIKAHAEEAKARANKATEGKWRALNGIDVFQDIDSTPTHENDFHICDCSVDDTQLRNDKERVLSHEERKANATFIAHSRTDIPALCSSIDLLAAEVERLQGELIRLKNALRAQSNAPLDYIR